MTQINQNASDHSHVVHNLQVVFDAMLVNYPSLISQISIGQPLTSQRKEWFEHSNSPIESTVTELSSQGSNTIKVASTNGLRVGSVLRFASAQDETLSVQAKVTALNGNTLTVVRPFGGTTDVDLPLNAKSYLVSSPKKENSQYEPSATSEATKEYNYSQIFIDYFGISRTESQVEVADGSNSFKFKSEEKMRYLYREMNSAALYGRRQEASPSNEGAMGGIFEYLENGLTFTGGGNAVSASILDNMLSEVYGNGAMSTNWLLVMNKNQSQKMAQFNSAQTNTRTVSQRDDRTAGGYMSKFESSLPIAGGFSADVWVDLNMPKDQILLLNADDISLHFMQDFQSEKLGRTGDGDNYMIRAEATLCLRNGKKGHAMAVGLEV